MGEIWRVDELEQCNPFDWLHLVLLFLSTLIVMSTAAWGERSTRGKLRVFSPFAGMRRVVARGGCVMSSFDGVVAVAINGCLIQCCLGFTRRWLLEETRQYMHMALRKREFFIKFMKNRDYYDLGFC